MIETQGSVLGGGPKGEHEVEGIGASFIPKTCDRSLADEVIAVSDHDAFDMVKKLAAIEGVLAGSSAGAAVFGAIEIARRLGPGKRVATIIPDSAERYLSKDIFHFNEKRLPQRRARGISFNHGGRGSEIELRTVIGTTIRSEYPVSPCLRGKKMIFFSVPLCLCGEMIFYA